jgi:hypothetical protein
MQVGDPKKTAMLAVVAVGALGFCFKQLLGGGGDGPKALRQANGGGGTAADSGQTPAPAMTLAMVQLDHLRTDPFSHPKLAPKTAGQTTPGGVTGQGGTPLVSPIDPKQGGDPQGQLPWERGSIGIDKTKPGSWPDPVNPGSKPGEVEVKKLTQVTLRAIVKVNERLAYISVDGQEAQAYRPGDSIKDDITVAFVNDDSVIVKNSKSTVTLKVGQQGDLK